MPTYSYQCEACKHEFEKEQRISENAIRRCPSCGKPKAKRLISSGNFILKGGGWYSDGYGAGGKPKGSGSNSSGGDSSSGGGTAGGGSKSSSGSGSAETASA